MAEDNCKIFVDADACPVKSEIAEVTRNYKNPVVYVASYNHAGEKTYGGEWVYVDAEKEEVDLYIVNHSKKGDLTVTQDIGLAGLLIPRGVHVISPRGRWLNEGNIDMALQGRYLSAMERKAGGRTKGPRKFEEADRIHFSKELHDFLSKNEGISS
ncbi:YaiI/YqxD family protein [Bacillus marinisedimentorum]|uniref:YaiI/YqxD family protein n=1 Tax=Bacillus marinisedimentorum TaxID=1821260 RepID=UPI000872C997|nr:DUF188 domain-containing protein [Bacillus marinisedimentorum]